MKPSFRFAVVMSISALLTACANFSAGSLFSHYSAQNRALYTAVGTGDYQQAQSLLSESVAGDILDNMEKGRVEFLNEQYDQSLQALTLSNQAVREQQDQALVSVSETVTNIGSLAVNDNLTTYQPADYELSFLYLYSTLNYLQKNDLEGALVEIRRGNMAQERAKQAREAELQKAQNEAESNGISPSVGSIISRYPDAGKKLQAVQNGYLLFLSALLYETDGDLNAAYIDYKRALAVAPNNPEIIDRTMRLARYLGMNEDLALLSKKYSQPEPLKEGEGRVIVLDEQSVVQAMQGWRLDLPIYDSRGNGAIYSVALPYYPNTSVERMSPLTIDNKSSNGNELTNVNLMAQQHLSEEITAIVLRQAVRVWLKDRIRKEAARGDDVGNLVLNIWNTVTEQPDTRSWLTLPASIKSHSFVTNEGTHTISSNGKDYSFPVRSGQTTLVWLSRQGNNNVVWHKQLGSIL
ncbi:COG3014 family protein [Vibrio maerlii]|uniref:COG3014 family protein n=1 Tax=Vibrio maerlii TaxID=2231648 RepID=UPI001F133AAF|nr:hypothetical protein [Vibrio maerlii]